MLFAEVGGTPDEDLFLRIDYDGAIAADGGDSLVRAPQHFAVLSGTKASAEAMERFLQEKHQPLVPLERALATGYDAWVMGTGSTDGEPAAAGDLADERAQYPGARGVEAALLERSRSAVRYRPLTADELRPVLAGNNR
jgi:hypothetical protein